MAVNIKVHIATGKIFLHIYVLSCLAIAQPIFDLLGKYPEFFIAHQSNKFDIALLTIFLVFILPFPLTIALAAVNKISKVAFSWVLALLLTLMGGLLALPLLKQTGFADPIVLLLAVCIGAAISKAYFNSAGVRQFMSVLVITLIIVPIYFLFFTSVYTSVLKRDSYVDSNTRSPSDTPVVVVIFDEFPVSAIMNENLEVDRLNFPNFARLADLSYWFRNATTIAGSTILAVPAILSGNIPSKFEEPTFHSYPNNIFTMLESSHRMYVSEEATRLCPVEICGESQWTLPLRLRLEELLIDVSVVYGHLVLPTGFANRLPSISSSWKEFLAASGSDSKGFQKRLSRARQFDRFLLNIKPEKPAGLYLIHFTFPHIPYEYLPSGKRYSGGDVMPGRDRINDRWQSDRYLIDQAYQRLLLQTGAADRMIGALLDRLEESQLLDSAVVVVTADHGVSFMADRSRRGDLRNQALESSIMPVPLFVKAPGQSESVVDDRNVQTIDILPTIVELAGVTERPIMDGQALIGNDLREPSIKTFFRGYRAFWKYEAAAHLDQKNQIIIWKYDNFYDRSRKMLAIYRVGPRPQLIKSKVEKFGFVTQSRNSFILDDSVDMRVDTKGDFIPAHIFGQINAENIQQPMELAIAINGIVQATGRSYYEEEAQRFSVMVPEEAFENGSNTLDIYSISEIDGKLQFRHLTNGGAQLDNYRLSIAKSGTQILSDANHQVPISTNHHRFEAKVETSIEGRDAVEFITRISAKKEELPLEIEILVFEDKKCIYKYLSILRDTDIHENRFVLPKSKFDSFDQLPIRFFAIDSLNRGRELDYYSLYPYLLD